MIRELIAGLALAGCVGCAASNKMLKSSGYYDTRGRVDGTVTAAGELPSDARYYGFLDYGTSGMDSDINKAYGQFKVFKTASNGLGVSTEYNRDFFAPADTIRVGPMYKFAKGGDSLTARFYPLATNNAGSQLALSGVKKFGDNYVEGFFNYNFKPNNIVTEIQYRRRLVGDLFGVAEFRHNGYKNSNGTGLGLEWKIK
ncbi:MAG: hypothetical protein WC613_03905 [Candidatus Aenigmatarchaeota archaeon]